MPAKLLQSCHLKATKQRVELLSLLRKQHQPRTAEQLQCRLTGVSLATVYRTVEEFVRVGLVHMIDLGHGHAHYEYADPQRHHHHLVCDDCGRVEDVQVPNETKIVSIVERKSKFTVRRHALEFFGVCADCQVG